MEAILAHPVPIFALLIGIFLMHLLERFAKKKGIFSTVAFVLHLVLLVFFVIIGASWEEMLFVLLLSAAVALA
ncbi:MAG: hypothetical protein E7654_03040 [Ruminococcaceae bacterium]|nr:hypothetical protein [Oscillospiraceae bacterium]